MTINVNDIILSLSPDRQAKIKARATKLIAEEMTLQDLRKARKFT
jgi:hypothetical protein